MKKIITHPQKKMYYSQRDYKLLGFRRSVHRHKKYDAILQHRANGKMVYVPFGDAAYAQYKDRTGLGLFTHADHLDAHRRALYRQRHLKDNKPGFYSPGYMAWYYLW